MPTKKIVFAIVAGFILMVAGRYLIHGVWLVGVYAENRALWRPQAEMPRLIWVIQVANLIFATAATLIYVRGREAKPWLGQGLRFGALLALVSECRSRWWNISPTRSPPP